jgi:hypothetical protein
MNEHFITGFVKAAKATGMSDIEIAALLKQAEPAMPQEEMPAEAPAEMPAEMSEAPAPEASEEAQLDELLSQLSPEEIEQLAQELANEMEGGSPEGDAAQLEQIPELAAAIEQQLGQNPEVAEATAPSPEMTEEVMAKQSAINFIKSAEYVEGFLEQAVNRGMNLKQAVELYDTAFSTTLNQLKTSELKGDQHKLDIDGDGKIEADDLKKLREGKKTEDKEAELKGDQHKLDVDGDGKIEADDLKKLREGKKNNDVDEKTAAYYEGVLERCREYGLSDAQAIEFVKSAAPLKTTFETIMNKGKSLATKTKDTAAGASNKAKNVASDTFGKAKETVKKHKGILQNPATMGAAGLATGGVVGHSIGSNRKKDEE